MVDLSAPKKVSATRRDGVPFPAIVGQTGLKEALLAVGANESLDGLLVRGEKGTAKSTAARALADLLPEQRAVADCPYGCPPDDPAAQCAECRERTDPPAEVRPAPFVTLPLGAARERVVGSLSVTSALDGEVQFNPGLLARANRGILYVDEVNLLDNHLVDALLDAAAGGLNRVERDGVSVTHPAEFTLVGTMNPEEGDLRPQFRDRFDLQVEVTGARDLDTRVEVVERAISGFDGDYAAETAATRERLHDARERLSDVTIPDSLVREAAELCRDAGVEGHRADIATVRAARTLAALEGRERVIESDLRRAAELALPHRLQSRPFEEAPDPSEVVDDHFEDGEDGADDAGGDEERGDGSESEADAAGDGGEKPGEEERGADHPESREGSESEDSTAEDERTDDPSGSMSARSAPDTGEIDGGNDGGSASDGATSDEPADEEATPVIPGSRSGSVPPGSGSAPEMKTPTAETASDGRRTAGPGIDGRGGRVRTERATGDDPVDAAASIRAAAARGGDRVTARDLRKSIRFGSASSLIIFAIDASASMRGPMRAAKGVALDLLRDAYERRDEVAVVTFAGERADVVLPPTDSVERAARHLKSLPTGDRTPLPAGLRATEEVLARSNPDSAVVVLVTDGRTNAGSDSPVADTRDAANALRERDANVLVVDAGDADDRSGLVPDLAAAADGDRVPLSALTPDRVADALSREGDR